MFRKWLTFPILAIVFQFFMVESVTATNVDLYNLIGKSITTWGETNATTDRIAEAFATNALNTVVTSVTANLYGVDGNTKTFNLDIYSNSGSNQPFQLVSNVVTGGSFASFSDANTVTFASLNIPLSPSTNYWLVMTPTVASTIRWGRTDQLTGGFAGFANAFLSSANSGSTWPTASVDQARMQIVGATPVPEASSLVMAGIAALACAVWRHRFKISG